MTQTSVFDASLEERRYPDWIPADWLLPLVQPSNSSNPTPAASQSEPKPEEAPVVSTAPISEEDGFSRTERVVMVSPSPDRTVHRKLKGIHLFMITINATVGTGLYWRGGQVLEAGGPTFMVLAFALVGLLSWAVMQGITEMLCIWPIPGAFSVYVSEFVDDELGIAVGVAYWYTYSVSFSAILSTIASEIEFWTYCSGLFKSNAFTAGLYMIMTLIMVAINTLRVELYGFFEVVCGIIKIVFYFVIVTVLIFINEEFAEKVSDGDSTNHQYCDQPEQSDTRSPEEAWVRGLFMSLSLAAFSYVGVEIVAASSLEVQPRRRDKVISSTAPELMVGKTVRWSSAWIPVIIGAAYTVAGVLILVHIRRADGKLPSFTRLENRNCEETKPEISIFVAIAEKAVNLSMDQMFNAFIVFTAATCANTNLYVASRSLFGLTSRLDGGPFQPWYLRILAFFGRTDQRKVPLRAIIFSAVAFWWLPFLGLNRGLQDEDGEDVVIKILASMGSVGVQLVWACESLAFIRYYHSISHHRDYLERHKVPHVRRWDQENHEDYPYRSPGQPYLAYISLISCMFFMLVLNSASLWKDLDPKEFSKELLKDFLKDFLSSYLIIFIFLVFWAVLKIIRGAKWGFVDLSNAERFVNKLRTLDDIRQGAS